MKLDDAISACLASVEAEGRSGRTVAAYGREVATLRAELGAVEVGTVRSAQLFGWASSGRVVLKVDGAPKNQSSVNRARSAVRGLFGFLTAGWIIDRDPSLVLRVKSTQPPPPSVLGQLDEAKLLQVMTQDPNWEAHRDALMLRTLLDTGIRVSGLVDLDRSDVDVERGCVVIRAKGGDRQEVRIDAALAAELVARAADDGVFATWRGRWLLVRQV